MRLVALDLGAGRGPVCVALAATKGADNGAGEPKPKTLPTTPKGWPRPAARRKPRAGFRPAPAGRWGLGGACRPARWVTQSGARLPRFAGRRPADGSALRDTACPAKVESHEAE